MGKTGNKMETKFIVIWTSANDTYVSNVCFSHLEDAETFAENVKRNSLMTLIEYTATIQPLTVL